MKKNKSKIFSKTIMIVLSVLLLLSFTACVKKDKIITDERNVTVNGNKVYVGNYSEKTLIKVDFFNTGYGETWLYESAKDFVYENQEYALYLSGDPSLVTNYETKLTAGKNLSDLYITPTAPWQSFAASGYLEPITDVYKTKPDGENGKTIEDKVKGMYKGAGKFTKGGVTEYYAMPWSEIITGIVYNDSLFQKYEISIPTTMAEFYTVCDTIIEKSTAEGKKIAPLVFPGKINGYFDFLGMNWWLQLAGIDGVNEFFAFDNVEVFNPNKSPMKEFKSSLEEFEKIFGNSKTAFEKYCLRGSMAKDAYTAQLDFVNGNAAMMINGCWLEQEMIKLIDARNFKTKMMRVPYLENAIKDDKGNYIPVNYAAADFDIMTIPKVAKQKDGAKKFMSFLTRDDLLQKFTKYTGTPRPFEYDLEPIKKDLTDFAKSAIEISETSTATFFDFATGPRRYKAKKFLTANPYMSIINGSSAATFVDVEYAEAKVRWDRDWKI